MWCVCTQDRGMWCVYTQDRGMYGGELWSMIFVRKHVPRKSFTAV